MSNLASASVDAGHLGNAWRCIAEAITDVETTQQRWCEAEVHRIAGEIAIKSGLLDVPNRLLPVPAPDRLPCPWAKGGRDEKALQSRWRTD